MKGVLEQIAENALILRNVCHRIKQLENDNVLTNEQATSLGGPLVIMYKDFEKIIGYEANNEKD